MVDINPGTGPVAAATLDYAQAAMEQFVADLRSAGHTVTDWPLASPHDDGGRWQFRLTVDAGTHDVDMPGLPLEQLRYLADPGQDAFRFVRLYVDGNSWLWTHALNACTWQ